MSEESDIRDLGRMLLGEPQSRTRMLTGEVTDTPGGGVITVILQAEDVEIDGIHYLDSYTPAIGDVIWLLKQDRVVIALGKLA